MDNHPNETFIDLRSDTVTKPTQEMLEAMFTAKVGDDVYGEDETINALQEKAAELFGMEAALFCPSGTMTNQIALKVLTQPGDEVMCFKDAHIYKYEGGGMMINSQLSPKLLETDYDGKIKAEKVEQHINPEDPHFPITKVVALENTANYGGGSTYHLSEIEAVHQVTKKYNLSLHLDGARVFNALVATGDDATAYGKYFDTISICLSKGLGCPVGSLLLSNQENIKKAKRVRKVLGGAMRQAGYLAAAGIYALDHHIERLQEDHQRAKELESLLQTKSWIIHMLPVKTNIILFQLENSKAQDFVAHMQKHQIKVSFGSANYCRLVIHLNFDDADLEKLKDALDSF